MGEPIARMDIRDQVLPERGVVMTSTPKRALRSAKDVTTFLKLAVAKRWCMIMQHHRSSGAGVNYPSIQMNERLVLGSNDAAANDRIWVTAAHDAQEPREQD
jgi:hypothetical protein